MIDLQGSFPFFLESGNLLDTTIVEVSVFAAIDYLFIIRETHHSLEAECRYEQRKKLRNVVARYHAHLHRNYL